MFQFPQTQDEWKIIAQEFENRWNFPHCVGAIDGKHVEIVPPKNTGSLFYNYKKRFSVVLMAIVDAKYRFILCDFGTNGRVSDGGVLLNTKFFEKFANNSLNIPPKEKLNHSSRILPYVFVADDAFALRQDMMKPFRQRDVVDNVMKRIYNYRISRARRVVENAFGILAARFRVFRTAINLSPENIESVVMASCALHNYLIAKLPSYYASAECFDQENIETGTTTPGLTTMGSTMEPLQRNHVGDVPNNAKHMREEFMDYFMNEGKVPWQDKFMQ